MTGIPHFNFPSFFEAERELEDAGWNVHNPARVDQEHGEGSKADGVPDHPITYYMQRDLPLVCKSHAIFALPGYKKSRGASLEIKVALELDIPVYSWEDLGAVSDPDTARIFSYTPEVALGLENIEVRFTPDEEQPTPAPVYIPVDEYEREARLIDPVTGGHKGQKLARFDLVPADALRALARHYGVGALKYDDDNWLKGYGWRNSIAALERHVNAFKRGESIYAECFDGRDGLRYDAETHHLIAAAWHCFALWVYEERGLGTDNR